MDEIVYNYYFIHGGFSSLATFIDGQNLFKPGFPMMFDCQRVHSIS